jgi:hypothetical protein
VIWEKRGRACENSHGTLWSRFRFFFFSLPLFELEIIDTTDTIKEGAWFFAKKNYLMLNFEKKILWQGWVQKKIIGDSIFTI